jgi:hypothetical protein
VEYSWTGELVNGRFSLSGFSNTRLFWASDVGKWKLELLDSRRVYATSNASDYPIGTFEWDFYNDDCNDDGAGQEASSQNIIFEIVRQHSSWDQLRIIYPDYGTSATFQLFIDTFNHTKIPKRSFSLFAGRGIRE